MKHDLHSLSRLNLGLNIEHLKHALKYCYARFNDLLCVRRKGNQVAMRRFDSVLALFATSGNCFAVIRWAPFLLTQPQAFFAAWDDSCIKPWDCRVAVCEQRRLPCHISTLTIRKCKVVCLLQSYMETTCVGCDAFVSWCSGPVKANILTCKSENCFWPRCGTLLDPFAYPAPTRRI